MLNLLIDRNLAPARLMVVLAVLLTEIASCELVDLRPVVITTNPAVAYSILPGRTTALSVGFSTEPERIEAERVFSVHSNRGTVEGDFSWEGNTVVWTPVEPWDPGIRYRLVMKGFVRMLDGREARPEIDVPFHVLRDTGLPILVSCSPLDAASVGVASTGSIAIEAQFSEAMDSRTVESAFNLVPEVGMDFHWNPEGTHFSAVPRERLTACTVYHWEISAEARALDGAPLANAHKASFVTDAVTARPLVQRVYPVAFVEGAWVESGVDLASLEAGHSIAVQFSEDVTAGKAESAVRIEEAMSGDAHLVSPDIVVYSPENTWLPEKVYTLLVSEDLENLSGLSMGKDYRLVFSTLTPFLELLSVSATEAQTLVMPQNLSTLAVTVWNEPEGILSLTLNFSAPFSPAGKVISGTLITLGAFFPASLPAPVAKSVTWPSDDTVILTWEGLRPSDAGTVNYYRLFMSGGPNGLSGSGGLYLKNDFEMQFEALE